MQKTQNGNASIESGYQLLTSKFKGLPSPEWEKIWPITSYKQVKKGTVFLEMGKICRVSAFVLSGLFKQTVFDEDTTERNLNFYFAGDLLCNCESYRNQRPSISSITALTDAELLVFTNDDLFDLTQSHLSMAHLGISITNWLLELEVDHLKLLSVKDPLQRYRSLLESKPHVIANISITEIARYLYISRETVSRARLKLTDEARNYCD